MNDARRRALAETREHLAEHVPYLRAVNGVMPVLVFKGLLARPATDEYAVAMHDDANGATLLFGPFDLEHVEPEQAVSVALTQAYAPFN